MKRTLIFLILFLIPIVYGIECQREMWPNNIPCDIISSWKPSGNCGDYDLTIYDLNGLVLQNLTWEDYYPLCKTHFNVTVIGTYHYNSSIEDGVINIRGDDENMLLVIGIFLIGINLLTFYLPFKVRFSKSEAGDYMVKRLMWIGSLLLLWFNTTIFRQLAYDWGLGIDNFLLVYWWIFTFGTFAMIFVMCYVMVAGSMKLMNEARMKKRMGDDGYQRYETD